MSTLATWKCVILECNKPRWVCNNVRKWTKNKQNVSVIGWTHNQVFVVGLAQDHRHVCMASNEHLLEVWKFFACVGNPSKKLANEDMIIP